MSRPFTYHASLFQHFLKRDILNRFLGSWSGAGWAFLHPVLMLMVYSFAFEYIFKARFPGVPDAGVLPYLAAGLWPWLAFTEALQRGVSAIEQNAGLLSKVALPSALLVIAPVAASVLLHCSGFVLVCVGLKVAGYVVNLWQIPALLLLYLLIFVIALGLSLLLAAVQVFVRDVAQFLPQFIALMFFLTPILYAPQMLPQPYSDWLHYNPMTPVIMVSRSLMLDLPHQSGILWSLLFAAMAMAMGVFVFRRLQSRFEDFL